MDLLSQHEAFLRAIFDAPDDDTPRLVYADFLEENGDAQRARLIRVQCEIAQLPGPDTPSGDPERLFALLMQQAALMPANVPPGPFRRGFPYAAGLWLDGNELHDPLALRQRIVAQCPQWFGVTSIRVRADPPLDPARVDVLLDLRAFTGVTRLEFGGVRDSEDDDESGELIELIIEPAITTAGVAALAANRAVRRITELVLTNNELDNDAARVLVKSPYLDNLTRLELYQGNQFRGRVWQQVLERFGEDVVG